MLRKANSKEETRFLEVNDPVWLQALSVMSSTARRQKFRAHERQAQFLMLGF